MATLGFTVQLYCDFSGYSDMAIGIALLMGYRFLENFNAPFKAQNPTEFWHRWHISLSTWLRDYVYIPLGGNRCSRSRMYFNQFATMVIGGLWHGASWMYVIWGAIHGGLLVVHKFLRRVFPLTVSRTAVTETGEVVVMDSGLSSSPWIKGFNMIFTFSDYIGDFHVFPCAFARGCRYDVASDIIRFPFIGGTSICVGVFEHCFVDGWGLHYPYNSVTVDRQTENDV